MSVTPETSVTPDPYGATMLNILKLLLFVLRHGGETPTNVHGHEKVRGFGHLR